MRQQQAAAQPQAQPGMEMQSQPAPSQAAPGARPGMEANDQLAGLPDNARRFIRGVSRENYLAMVGARTMRSTNGAGVTRAALVRAPTMAR